MGIETLPPPTAASADHKRGYRIGAIAALVLTLGYIAIFPLYAHVGAPPSNAETWLVYLPGKTTTWWLILGLSVFTDLLLLPIALALYQELKEISKSTMRIAAVLMGSFVMLDLAVTWTHYASILTLYERYSATVDPAKRTACATGIEYASAMLASPIEIVYAIVILSVGILLTGLVMLKSRFRKINAFLAIATGILGIASLSGFNVTIIGNALCATIWFAFVAIELFRLSKP